MSRESSIKTSETSDASADPAPEDFDFQINLRLRLDEVADLEADELRRQQPTAVNRKELCRLACRIFEARRARDRLLDRKLFGEPAWDILLALYCLPARGERLTVTGLSFAAEVQPTTGHRWQAILIREGLIERGPPELDQRKHLVRLTKLGRDLLESYLTKLFYCETSIPDYPEAHDD